MLYLSAFGPKRTWLKMASCLLFDPKRTSVPQDSLSSFRKCPRSPAVGVAPPERAGLSCSLLKTAAERAGDRD
jgi:hypothetical protein